MNARRTEKAIGNRKSARVFAGCHVVDAAEGPNLWGVYGGVCGIEFRVWTRGGIERVLFHWGRFYDGLRRGSVLAMEVEEGARWDANCEEFLEVE